MERIWPLLRTAASVPVAWEDPEDAWRLYTHTLFHELGHHYVNQCRSSRGRPKTRKRNESLADLHDPRLTVNLVRKIAKRRSGA